MLAALRCIQLLIKMNHATMHTDNFTEEAQTALHHAQKIMREQQHTQLDVEHIFLALLQQPDGLTRRVLARLEANADAIAQQIERELDAAPRAYGQPTSAGNQVYSTPRTLRLIQNAHAQARQMGAHYIGVPHLLLAIVNERAGVVNRLLRRLHLPALLNERERISARILTMYNISPDSLYQAVMKTHGG